MGVNDIALGFTLGIAAFTDWREQKIYNKLLIPAFLTALLLNTFQEGSIGLTSSLLGAFIGFCLLLLPYLMGGIGAGDVKLLMVIGAFGGTVFVIKSFLYGAVVGGLISGILLTRRKALGYTLKHFLLIIPFLNQPYDFSRVLDSSRQEKFPYGIAIVLGTLLALSLGAGGGGL